MCINSKTILLKTSTTPAHFYSNQVFRKISFYFERNLFTRGLGKFGQIVGRQQHKLIPKYRFWLGYFVFPVTDQIPAHPIRDAFEFDISKLPWCRRWKHMYVCDVQSKLYINICLQPVYYFSKSTRSLL